MTTCPQCGHTEVQKHEVRSGVMNHYVDSKNPKTIVVLNDNREEVILKGVTHILKSVFDKRASTPASTKPSNVQAEPALVGHKQP
jgi:hypothetical protein